MLTQDDPVFLIGIDALKKRIVTKKIEPAANGFGWTLEAHARTKKPVIQQYTGAHSAARKSLEAAKGKREGMIGAEIVSVDGKKTSTLAEAEAALAAAKGSVAVMLLKPEEDPSAARGSIKVFALKPDKKHGFAWALKDDAEGHACIEKFIKMGANKGPAEKDDVPKGAKILQINKKPVHGVKEVQRAIQKAGDAKSEFQVEMGLGRIVALHHRPSTLYQIHEHIRCLYFYF